MVSLWERNNSLKDKKLWLFLHWFLTESIILLGIIRDRIEKRLTMVTRKDRTFRNHLHELYHYGIFFICCDCGLAHQMFIRGDYVYMRAERPLEYNYQTRYFARQSDPTYKGEIPPWQEK